MESIEKLKLDKSKPLVLLHVPPVMKYLFEMYETLPASKISEVQQVLVFAQDKNKLKDSFSKIMGKLKGDTLLWIAYPKKSGSIKSDISRDNGWDMVRNAGYDGVMQVSLNNDWSALRFRRSDDIKNKKRDIPMSERQTPGVDYVNRLTVLPEDVRTAMRGHMGLETFFEMMSFSHRKEYLEAIADARKPETRIRRISNMIESLIEMKKAKEQKIKK